MFAATILVGVLCADPARFIKASLAASAPLQRPPSAVVNVYETGSASFLEQSADPRTDRSTQAPLVRMKLQKGGAAAFLSEHGDSVASLAAALSGSGAEQALIRLNELPASTLGDVKPALRALLADQSASERVRQLAGSLAAHITDAPVASEQMDAGTGSGGNVYVTLPSPSRVYGHGAASFLGATGSDQTASVPNEVNVVYNVPASSFLARKSSSQISTDDAVNVHVQTLSEPLAPFLRHLADMTAAAEQATSFALAERSGPSTVNVHIPDSPRDGLDAGLASMRSRIAALEARAAAAASFLATADDATASVNPSADGKSVEISLNPPANPFPEIAAEIATLDARRAALESAGVQQVQAAFRGGKASFLSTSGVRVATSPGLPLDASVKAALEELDAKITAKEQAFFKHATDIAAKQRSGSSFMETRGAGDANIKITNSKTEWPTVPGLALGMIARAEDSARAVRQATLDEEAKARGASLLQEASAADVDVTLQPPTEDASAIAASLKGLSAVVDSEFAHIDGDFEAQQAKLRGARTSFADRAGFLQAKDVINVQLEQNVPALSR